MPIDVIVAWVWILAGAFVSTLGILLAYRRAGAAALYVYVGGLLLLAVSVFKVHPALVRFSLPQDVQTLQDELSGANSKFAAEHDWLVAARAQLRDLEASAKTTEKDLAATKTATTACRADKAKEVAGSQQLRMRIDQDGAELDSLRNKFSLLSSEHKSLADQLEALKEEHRATLQSYETKETLLAANIHHLNLAETEKASLANELTEKEQELAGARETIAQLKEQLVNTRTPEAAPHRVEFTPGSSPMIGVEKLENKELVQGEIGDYYLITFKDAKTLSPITFSPASFVITDKVVDLRSAMQELGPAVLQQIPPSWHYKIFVRGHADGGTFKEPIGDENYRDLEFLPRSDASGFNYQAQLVKQRLSRDYENENLPNLRAAFMARTLLETLKGEAPVLLGNSPEPGSNSANRRAEVILFLKPAE